MCLVLAHSRLIFLTILQDDTGDKAILEQECIPLCSLIM